MRHAAEGNTCSPPIGGTAAAREVRVLQQSGKSERRFVTVKLDDPTLSPDLEATGVQFQGHVESHRLGGAPGTGKTLLAKAVAREAGVPFFSLSGANFVGKFLGMGAARVRDLFTQAQATALNIILIDELDVLGKTRGISPMMDGYDERGQTLETLRHPQ